MKIASDPKMNDFELTLKAANKKIKWNSDKRR
jgi:hypothetical protein